MSGIVLIVGHQDIRVNTSICNGNNFIGILEF